MAQKARFRRSALAWVGRACLVTVAAVIGAGPVVAQTPFGFLFGSPPRQRFYRPRRVRPPTPVAMVPLPVPRPHFPGDPPTAGRNVTAIGAPEVAPPGPPSPPATAPLTTAAPAEMAKPREPERAADGTPEPGTPAEPTEIPSTVPIPPPKPEDLTKPAETAKPEAAKPIVPGTAGRAPEPTAKPPETSTSVPVPPPKPADLTKPGELGKLEEAKPGTPTPAAPAVAPSGATTAFAPRSPDDDPQCPGRLKARGVAAEPIAIGPQPDARCTVVEPVRLTGLTLPDGGKVDFPDKPTVACTTADAFSLYVRDLLVPLAKGTFGSPISAVATGPGLECRSRDHIFGAKLSAHGQGLAIDIAELALADKRVIAVGSPKTDQETGFETASRAGACGYFHTVLGPGSDAYHRTHWHFDLEVRGAKGDSKYCK